MTKENKIVKYGLESETDALLDQGLSLDEIATALRNNHSDIADIQSLAGMSVMRYRDSRDKMNIVARTDEGEDYVDTFMKEFKKAMKDLNRKTDDVYNRCIKLLSKLELEENNDTTLKAIREITNSIEQQRKNWTSLAQYGVRQTSNIYNINLKKEQTMKIQLLDWSKNLCASCREKKYKELFEDNVKIEVEEENKNG